MADLNLSFDLDKYPTLLQFAQSEALIRIVIGPAGSAKTSYAVMELLRLAILQEPNHEGIRNTSALIIRNTFQLLRDNTVRTVKQMFGGLYHGTESTTPKGKVRFGLPDGTTVNFDIRYLSMDDEDSQKKLLGDEPTFVFIDEISELPESLVHAAVRRLGRYPSGAAGSVTRSCLIAATNGPKEGHWIHNWWLGAKDVEFHELAQQMGVPEYARIFRQPPALLRRPDGKWDPNPLAENIHNLKAGYGYYYAMLADPDPAKIAAYVEGEFADLKEGKPVWPEFNKLIHTAKDAVVRPRGGFEMALGLDFGRTPVILIGYIADDGAIIVLDEVMGDNMAIETLVTGPYTKLVKSKMTACVIGGAFGDPAGQQGGQGLELSPFQVLHQKGIPVVAPVPVNDLDPRLAAVRKVLTQLTHRGRPRLIISDNCPLLINALYKGYIYPKLKTGGGDDVRETPTKSHVNWVSDLADALQYLVLGCTLLQLESEALSASNRPEENINWV